MDASQTMMFAVLALALISCGRPLEEVPVRDLRQLGLEDGGTMIVLGCVTATGEPSPQPPVLTEDCTHGVDQKRVFLIGRNNEGLHQIGLENSGKTCAFVGEMKVDVEYSAYRLHEPQLIMCNGVRSK